MSELFVWLVAFVAALVIYGVIRIIKAIVRVIKIKERYGKETHQAKRAEEAPGNHTRGTKR